MGINTMKTKGPSTVFQRAPYPKRVEINMIEPGTIPTAPMQKRKTPDTFSADALKGVPKRKAK